MITQTILTPLIIKRKLLELPQLKQKTLAIILGVSEATISYALSGKRKRILRDINLVVDSHRILRDVNLVVDSHFTIKKRKEK